MEHLAKIVEAALAVFGAGKFCHEMYELVHHLVHFVKK
jgi:hypothetical protein